MNRFCLRILLLILVCGSFLPQWMVAQQVAQQESNRYEEELNAHWEFREIGKAEWLPATVPGTVHTDLYQNGSIPDPFYGDNETSLQWIEERNWEYRLIFNADADFLAYKKVELVFEGLDTYSSISLNGKPLGRTDNMFRSWTVSIREALVPGKNTLKIVFLSPVKTVEPLFDALPYTLPADNDQRDKKVSVHVRKAAYHFGWDWAPRFVTMGIWRPVRLQAWQNARITDCSVETKELTPETGKIRTQIKLEADRQWEVRLLYILNEDTLRSKMYRLQKGVQEIKQEISIDQPELWWPNGHGAAHLYSLEIQLMAGAKVLDSHTQKFGLRTVELVREKDTVQQAGKAVPGESFYFRVNGRPIFIKGANYIPGDNFIPRSLEKREALFESLQSTNFNMLRIWGGGVYEDEDFYNRCDEAGILIWQDLMFAGGMYPSNPEFRESVKAEIAENITRIRKHPCLALWCGNNEIEVAWANWGWQQTYSLSPTDSAKIWEEYLELFHELISQQLNALDPGRPYIASSPISNWGPKGDFNTGNMHYWGVWHGTDDFSGFEQYLPRFMAEYGFQSYPGIKTVSPMASEAELKIEGKWMQDRQKSYKGNTPILKEMETWYGEAKDFPSFLVLSQLLQREAMTLAITSQRIARPHCMGTLYWQLNDCWPGPSWSTIDYAGRKKAAHYALSRLYAPLMVVTKKEGDSLAVHIASDFQTTKSAVLEMRLWGFDGELLWSSKKDIQIPANASGKFQTIPLDKLPVNFDPQATVLETVILQVGLPSITDLFYFEKPLNLQLTDPKISLKAQPTKEGYLVSLKSKQLVKNLEIEVERMEVEVSDNYFDLLPGREVTVSIKTLGDIKKKKFLRRVRLRSLNDWVK